MTNSKVRKKYSDEFRQGALKHTDQIGSDKASKRFSLNIQIIKGEKIPAAHKHKRT